MGQQIDTSERRWNGILFVALILLFFGGGAGLIRYALNFRTELIETAALQNARLQSRAIEEFRSLYTSEVVQRLETTDVKITHDYQNYSGAIPLPATLSMLLGNRISETETGASARLYSPYPFPWRKNSGGLRDAFAQDAWQALNLDPATPFYRTEIVEGKPSLRYATADLMRESCINCHNSHVDSPKTDWKNGDVRGVVEVTLPLFSAVGQTAHEMEDITLLLILTGLIGLAGTALALLGMYHTSTRLGVVTEEKQAETELRYKAEQELMQQQHLVTLGALIGEISHDLRNPLGIIRLSLNLITHGVKGKDTGTDKALQRAERNIGRCEMLINEILGFFNVDNLHMHDTQVDEWLKGVIEDFNFPPDIKVLKNIDSGISLPLDSNQLSRCVINVLTNACQAIEEMGKEHKEKLIQIGCHSIDNLLQITFRDTGTGIAETDLQQIFEPMYSTKEKGTGLGLNIVRQIIERHGGRVDIKSSLGKGTTITFNVPRKPSA